MNADYCQVCGCDICCCVFEDGLVVITPEEAKKLLKGSSDNRPLDETLVNKFAEDMLKGKWKHPEVDVPSDLDQSNPVDLTKQEWSDIYSDPDYEDFEP